MLQASPIKFSLELALANFESLKSRKDIRTFSLSLFSGMAGHGIEGYAGAFATATAAAGDQSNIYSHSSSSFHLYNRPGQSWYSGN